MLIEFNTSLALSTFAKLTTAFAIPTTVPVNAGLARGALAAKAIVIAEAQPASLFNAEANSLRVFSAEGACPYIVCYGLADFCFGACR